jgi:hypothetical protein
MRIRLGLYTVLATSAAIILTGCGVHPKNSDQEFVLSAIDAAADADDNELRRLTGSAILSESFEEFHFTLRQILNPSGCSLAQLDGGGGPTDPIVRALWACHNIQGHQVNFTMREGRIVEIWWHPDE